MYEFINKFWSEPLFSRITISVSHDKEECATLRSRNFYLRILHKTTRHDAVAYDRCLLDLTDAVASAMNLSGSGVRDCLFEKSSNKEIQCTTN